MIPARIDLPEPDYWTQLVLNNIAGIIASVLAAVIVVLLRRQLGALFGSRHAAESAAESAAQGAVSAAQGAQEATETRSDLRGLSSRLRGVEGVVEGVRDDISASLGHRATEDLRFRRVEARLEELERERKEHREQLSGSGGLPAQGDRSGGGSGGDRGARVGSDEP